MGVSQDLQETGGNRLVDLAQHGATETVHCCTVNKLHILGTDKQNISPALCALQVVLRRTSLPWLNQWEVSCSLPAKQPVLTAHPVPTGPTLVAEEFHVRCAGACFF